MLFYHCSSFSSSSSSSSSSASTRRLPFGHSWGTWSTDMCSLGCTVYLGKGDTNSKSNSSLPRSRSNEVSSLLMMWPSSSIVVAVAVSSCPSLKQSISSSADNCLILSWRALDHSAGSLEYTARYM
uniref:Putative uncharacterized protein YML012C-A n=1 Tax=Saccharomyces cerevisiae (strain ATCC 204508 / S288c) TaxID=559292 RepID=YM012_YEAST|nr:RecName: Full=Putative uncharacterized protein YML012C-A [Saccharomyces cerevisiae S288C]pir/S69871/ hypothetical protein YML012c-a - yeast (Saccharomyces cerevisiae) [Saccharomyces cerevisiae]AAT93311.1 YML013C-A [Saccharomyces cerevisiae]